MVVGGAEGGGREGRRRGVRTTYLTKTESFSIFRTGVTQKSERKLRNFEK